MMKKVMIILIIMASLFLSGCEVGKEDTIYKIKYDMSVEYQVPITDIEVETIKYGITIFTTNQFKVTIESKGLAFSLVDMDGTNSYTRFPIPINE
jgi:protein involved in sex pheromone biosynthesis